MQCLTLALENPPKVGEYRVFNQFEEVHDLTELALKVQRVARKVGLFVPVTHLENPRVELEDHYYKPDHQRLLDLKYQPTHDVEAEIEIMLHDLMPYRDRIARCREALVPDLRWDGERRKVRTQEAPAPVNAQKLPRTPVAPNETSFPTASQM